MLQANNALGLDIHGFRQEQSPRGVGFQKTPDLNCVGVSPQSGPELSTDRLLLGLPWVPGGSRVRNYRSRCILFFGRVPRPGPPRCVGRPPADRFVPEIGPVDEF